ncbi:MAG: LAGLIDADG family homing endonuclease [Candidatus Bathyarchaeia archaeon]
MGSGLHTKQAKERFHLGQEIESGSPADCPETAPERYEIGEYIILQTEEGFHVSKGDQEIGSFAEVKVLIEENRALFKLSKGMLLEVVPEGHRQIFSREKASLHGAACADGSLACGAYWEKYRGKWGWHYKYEIRLSESNPAVRSIFAENFEKVYDLKAHDYPKRDEIRGYGKEMAYDFAKYGPIYTYAWRVPFEHLDKEGARCWLSAYFEGDGYLHTGDKPSSTRVVGSSSNKRGLEEVQTLLRDFFGIKSTISHHGYEKTKATESWSEHYDLEIARRDDA